MTGPVPALVPRPLTVERRPGRFALGPATGLAAEPELMHVAAGLRGALQPATGLPLPPATPGAADAVTLRIDDTLPAEGYRLRVLPAGRAAGRVELAGGDPAGVQHGVQTLRQLLPAAALRRAPVRSGPWGLPAVEITDAPRFRWRGCLLDVARHFLPVREVLRYLDLLALHKLNVLHLHLTDDQGWRMPVPGFPRLTEVGGWRAETMLGDRRHGRTDGRPHGGYYTVDDLREIVGYAAARHITVVPEVDLPGHTQAAIAAYPWLGNTGAAPPVRTGWGISRHVLSPAPEALAFCRDVLDAVCAVFPSRYIGFGGDECPPHEWRASPAARRRATQLGLPGPDALYGWYVRELAGHLAARGRVPYGWDEVCAAGAPPGTLIAAWRGPAAAVAAAHAGHDVVSCPDMSVYLDYRQSDRPDEPIPVGTVLDLPTAYAFEPVPAELTGAAAERIIGTQCQVWTEHLPGPRAVDYMMFPRLCAFAEIAWGTRESFRAFRKRLAGHLPRLAALGVEHRPESGPRPWQRRPDAPGWPRERADREAELAALTAALRARRPAP